MNNYASSKDESFANGAGEFSGIKGLDFCNIPQLSDIRQWSALSASREEDLDLPRWMNEKTTLALHLLHGVFWEMTF